MHYRSKKSLKSPLDGKNKLDDMPSHRIVDLLFYQMVLHITIGI